MSRRKRGMFHWARRGIQFSFLALFVVMAWSATYPPSASLPGNIFLRIDPLAAVTAAGGSNLWLYLLPAWILLGLTLLSGRFFCAWICPLGSVLGMVPSLESRRKRKLSDMRPKDIFGATIAKGAVRLRFKYLFLALLILLFLVGVNAVWIFDPLVIANRALSFVLIGSIPFLFIALLVLAVTVGPRFWCQEMCPLGAGLSLASMAGSRLPAKASPLSLFKDDRACTHCGECARACPFGIVEVADSEVSGRLSMADCALCGECVTACPQPGALSLRVMGGKILSSAGKGNPEAKLEEAVACEN